MFTSGRQSIWNTASGGDLVYTEFYNSSCCLLHHGCSLMARQLQWARGNGSFACDAIRAAFISRSVKACWLCQLPELIMLHTYLKNKQSNKQTRQPRSCFYMGLFMNHLYKMHMTHTHLSGGGTEPSKALQGTDEMFPGSWRDKKVVTAAPGEYSPSHLLQLASLSLENTNKPTQFAFS